MAIIHAKHNDPRVSFVLNEIVHLILITQRSIYGMLRADILYFCAQRFFF